MKQYTAIYERGRRNWSAYVPDLPGCVVAAASREEVVTLIQEAIKFHIEGLKESCDSVAKPISRSELVDVHAA